MLFYGCPKEGRVRWTMKSVLWALALVALTGAEYSLAGDVIVGQVAPLSGMEASKGRGYAAGMQLLFDSINKAGGVNGHTFKLVRRDDGGRPKDTVNLTKSLISESAPLVLAGYFGGGNVRELVQSGILEKEKIVLVGYRAAEILPDPPRVYGVRASLRDEIHKLTEHLATIGMTRLGLLYEEGAGAQSLNAAVDESAKKAGATIVSRGSHPLGTTTMLLAVNALLKSDPQAILVMTSAAAAAAFTEQYRMAGGVAQLFAHSGADMVQGVTIAQVTPSPYKVSNPLTKELADLVAKTPKIEVPISYAMIEGYIAAKVIVEAVRRQGSRPTREGMPAAIESISQLDLGGYVVNFGPGQRSGSKFVELSIVTSAGKVLQ